MAWCWSGSAGGGGSTLRRTLALAGLAAFGALLVVLVRAPERPPGLGARGGHRVFRVRPAAVTGIDVTLGQRRFAARRTRDGWQLDGRPASANAHGALDDLLATLAALRAVDVFRPRDAASFGLERPRATIAVHTLRRTRRVALGAPNSAGNAYYARRDDDPRVLQVGAMLLSSLERVFFTRDGARSARAQPPEIG